MYLICLTKPYQSKTNQIQIWGWMWNHILNNLYSWNVLIVKFMGLFLSFSKPNHTKPSLVGWKFYGWMWNNILSNFYLWYLIALWVNSGVLPNQTIPNQAKSAANSLETIVSNSKQLLPLTLYCISQIMATISLPNRKRISNLPFWGP